MEESNAKKISSVKIGRDGSVRVAYEDDVEMTYQDDGMVSEAFSNAWSALRPILSRVYGLSTGLMGITGLETGESDDGAWFRVSGYFPSPVVPGFRFPISGPKMFPYASAFASMNEDKQHEYMIEHKHELSDEDMNVITEAFGAASRYVDGERCQDSEQQELDFDNDELEKDDFDNDESGMNDGDPNEFRE